MNRLACSKSALLLFSLIALAYPGSTVQAIGLTDELQNLLGYVVLDKQTIEQFEGCEWGNRIEFLSGDYVVCQEYRYQYAFHTPAVLLVRPLSIGGVNQYSCKMVVQDTLYDVDCLSYMKQRIRAYRQLSRSPDQELAQYSRYWLQLISAQTNSVSCEMTLDTSDSLDMPPKLKEWIEKQMHAIEEQHPDFRSIVANSVFQEWVAMDDWRVAAADSWNAVQLNELLRQWKEVQIRNYRRFE